MRLIIKIKPLKPLSLPIHYQQILQGLIYRKLLNKELSEFLHNQGFFYHKRSFKLFTFSRLFGTHIFDHRTKRMIFTDDIYWQVSSVNPEFIQELGQRLLLSDQLYLDGQAIQIEELQYQNNIINTPKCQIKMLSPITVYSTYLRENGQKHTMYYTPKDEMFYQLIEENLKKKYEAYTGKEVVGTFTIKPKKIRENDKVVTRFKGFIINAWNGVYELEGNPELINFAYQVGLSNRNSQGFGMFQVI